MKIIITGGLGYIGTEICKIFSGETRKHDITVLDSSFGSGRVSQLKDWGIKFIQCDLFDDKLKTIIYDADVIIHLAGITDVPYVKSNASKERDDQIKKISIEGTRNIIRYSSDTCKIIFPSTHVVYEGFSETKLDIVEDVPICPVLEYSRGKGQSEYDLINSNKNYVILRLASLYGYSNDSMRINIMPNLFSKIAAENGTIKLFSKGIQVKSLVSLIDVARCFKFIIDNNINKEIFHVSNENLTVKEVANICKQFKPNLNIIETEDEIPNLGYTLSNKKLLNTGFSFLYNIENSIKEMIHKFSNKDFKPDLEYIINGDKEFIDYRGKISNYELPEPINLIGYIESKANTVRANHYHPIQEQKCLLIKGKYISVTKDLLNKENQIETRLINAGDLSVIKPNVIHTMVFLEDSIFLNLVRGEREHENYGITHTIPYELVDKEFKNKLISNFSKTCRSCNSEKFSDVISLGLSPLANNLISDKNEIAEMFPLEVKVCNKCFNCQLSYVVEPEKMFSNYLYKSSTTESFRNHFSNAADNYINKFNLNENSLVVDIGSNDGIALRPFKQNKINILGIEPAKNLSDLANKEGILTINSFFNSKLIDENLNLINKADLVLASNVFAHADNLKEITEQVFRILKKDGSFIIEVQYVLDTIRDLTFDNIYHEHVNYWSLTSLNNFFNNLNLCIYDVEHVNTHGGSIRVYISKDKEITKNVNLFLENEYNFGLTDLNTYKEFGSKINQLKVKVKNNIKSLKNKFNKIYAYGSPAKATTALNYFGIDNTYIECTIEDNDLKVGKYIPGVNIPIKDKKFLYKNKPDLVIVLAWNFLEEIKNNNIDLINQNVKFISIKDLLF